MARATDESGYYPNYRRARGNGGAVPYSGSNPETAAQRRVARSQFLQSSQRVNQYGTANPYAQSTNQNPYVGIAWLGSGFPHPLPAPPPNVPVPDEFQALQYGASRPTYDLAGIAALLGPYFHVPIPVEYNVLRKIRETIPMITAAILRMRELVGCPEVQASPSLKAKIDAFLRVLPVNRMQTGIKLWAQTHLDNMYTYGRAHSEVLLNNRRDDVFGLVEVHPATAGLRPTFGGYATNVVQYQYGGGVPVTLIPELLLNSVNDIRGDDPNGTSLIAELPFVSQILNAMLRSLGNTWDRFGSPTYWVNWEPPQDWEDPTGALQKQILGPMQSNFRTAMRQRAEGQSNDFWTTGKTTVEILGAQGEQLEFQASGRAIMEQIAARFGLPPFMYGFSWASTERMSTAQAKMVTEIIESSREVVEPAITKLITLWQLVTGTGGRFSLTWPRVSLQDLVDEARARAMDAQAMQAELASWDRMVRLGIHSIEEMAIEFREDMDDLTPDQVRKRLDGQNGMPELVTELPDFMPAPYGGEIPGPAGGGPAGSPDQQLPGGNNPREEQTRALVNGNGNGRY
jgi:hypothetical protein